MALQISFMEEVRSSLIHSSLNGINLTQAEQERIDIAKEITFGDWERLMGAIMEESKIIHIHHQTERLTVECVPTYS